MRLGTVALNLFYVNNILKNSLSQPMFLCEMETGFDTMFWEQLKVIIIYNNCCPLHAFSSLFKRLVIRKRNANYHILRPKV